MSEPQAVDLEIYEAYDPKNPIPPGFPIKPRNVRINGVECATSALEGEGIVVHPLLGDPAESGCVRVTMTVFARSLKIHYAGDVDDVAE